MTTVNRQQTSSTVPEPVEGTTLGASTSSATAYPRTVDSCPLTFKKRKNMKKYIITLVFALGLGLNLSAQSDGFFSNSRYSEYREDPWAGDMPGLPSHGYINDYDADNAPLGSGLLLLGGMALGYAAMRRKK